MTNERPEENANALDGAGEEADFHQASAGESLWVGLFYTLTEVEKKQVRISKKGGFSFRKLLIFNKIWQCNSKSRIHQRPLHP